MDIYIDKNQRYLLYTIYFIFVFSLSYIIGNAIKLPINIIYQILTVTLSIAIVKYALDRPLILAAVLMFILIVSAFINQYIIEFIPIFIDRLISFSLNIYQNLNGSERIFQENILPFWIVILIIISSFTYYFIFKKQKPWILFSLYMPVFIYYWYKFYDSSYLFLSLFLLGFIILIGIDSYIKESSRISNPHEYDTKEIYPNWRSTLISYAFIIIILALLIPKNTDFIAWPWLNSKVVSVFPSIEEFRSSQNYSRRNDESDSFDFASTGFMGKDKKLGGSVELSDKIVMTVWAPRSIYLRGNIKEEYNGFKWISVGHSYSNYKLGSDFSDLDDQDKSSYYQEEDITIKNNLFASTTIFSPYRPSKVFSNDKHNLLVDLNQSIKVPNGIYKDERYVVRYQDPLPYGISKSRGKDESKSELIDLENYLQISNTISDRTIKLTDKIVLDKGNDLEKAVAIESYLRANYNYSLEVEDIPYGSEFIDYFLFESKEGYCTYHASAMAIMLRIQDIPSRYVEGYLVKERIEDGKYQVRQKNAHAWVEAFIEPVGWMTFEATPAYSISPRYENYSLSNESIGEFSQENPDIELEDFEKVGGDRKNTEDSIEDDGNIDIYERGSDKDNFNYKYTLFIMISIIFIFVFFYPLKNMITIIKNKRSFKSANNNDQIVLLYRDICDLIAVLEYPIKSGETHFEYADRINHKFYNLDDMGIKEVTDIFVKAKYSQDSSSSEEVVILSKYKNILESRVKISIGRVRYYYSKYIK